MGLHKSKLGDDDHWRAFSYSKCIYLMHSFSSLCRAKASYSSNQSVEELSSSYQKLCRGPLSQRCWGKDRSKGRVLTDLKVLCPADIVSPKIEEILQTGQLRRIGYEKTEEVEISRLFQGIYGVGMIIHLFKIFVPNITHDLGQSIAHQWYLAGCRTLEDVRTGKGGVKMSTVQEIGLRFYDGWSSLTC